VPHIGRSASPRLSISTSFGFGGHNACLVLALPEDGGRASSR